MGYYVMTVRGTDDLSAVGKAATALPYPRTGEYGLIVEGSEDGVVVVQGYTTNAMTAREIANRVASALEDEVAIEIELTRTHAWGTKQLDQG